MKQLHLIAVSGRAAEWAAAAEQFYCRQMRCFQLNMSVVRPAGKDKEAARILNKLPAAAHVVLLAVAGCRLDSPAFAAATKRWLQNRSTVLVIAGAEGPAAILQQRADETVSLSALTFPHTLARLILIEQLFRADCTMRRHPYPR